MAELEKELAAVRSVVDAERNRLADLDRQKRTLEQNVTDEKDKVKKWEARLAEQRSTREYAALAREIDIARKANATAQEEVGELVKQQTAAREAVRQKEQEFAARQDQIGGRITELQKQIEGSQDQTRQLQQKREEAAKSVDRQ